MADGARGEPLSPGAWRCAALVVVAAVGGGPVAQAQGGLPNACDAEGDVPDVIVGDLHEIEKNGTVGGISAYTIGTTSCNVGTCWIDWFQLPNPRHPQITGNIFRLKDGRFEHLGQSWVKQAFLAVAGSLCEGGCLGSGGQHLGVNCSDPYSAGHNAAQINLGPKDAVHASTGLVTVPVRNLSMTGNSIFKRIQVQNAEIDPALNPGALYFAEGMYLPPDDAPLPDTDDDATPGDGIDDFDQVDNSSNNSSYRGIQFAAETFNPSFAGQTVRRRPAIFAWAVQDPEVLLLEVAVPGDGRYWVGSKATDLGNGLWHYEYAVLNHTSDRSARSFSVPVPLHANSTSFGFRDVAYHSENPDGSGSWYDGTDWVNNGGDGGHASWSAVHTFEEDPLANALRWNTLYNFRFDSDAPPASGTAQATIVLFKPGTPVSVVVEIVGPSICDTDAICDAGETADNCSADCVDQGGGGGLCGDQACDAGETPCTCTRDCGAAPTVELQCGDGQDDDCDGLVDCTDFDCCFDGRCRGRDADGDGFALCDCDDASPSAWSPPGEVQNLTLGPGSTLTWDPPDEPGALSVTYEALRSENPANFVGSTVCLPDRDPMDAAVVDTESPASGSCRYYDVRAVNACPQGIGVLGRDSNNIPREGRDCP